jgi:hypothetical protein
MERLPAELEPAGDIRRSEALRGQPLRVAEIPQDRHGRLSLAWDGVSSLPRMERSGLSWRMDPFSGGSSHALPFPRKALHSRHESAVRPELEWDK